MFNKIKNSKMPRTWTNSTKNECLEKWVIRIVIMFLWIKPYQYHIFVREHTQGHSIRHHKIDILFILPCSGQNLCSDIYTSIKCWQANTWHRQKSTKCRHVAYFIDLSGHLKCPLCIPIIEKIWVVEKRRQSFLEIQRNGQQNQKSS